MLHYIIDYWELRTAAEWEMGTGKGKGEMKKENRDQESQVFAQELSPQKWRRWLIYVLQYGLIWRESSAPSTLILITNSIPFNSVPIEANINSILLMVV